jgi:hypothetical protein
MLFDLTFPCHLTSFSGKRCLSGNVICAFFCPAYRSSPVLTKPTAAIKYGAHLQNFGDDFWTWDLSRDSHKPSRTGLDGSPATAINLIPYTLPRDSHKPETLPHWVGWKQNH